MEDKEHGISMHGHRTRINHDNIKSAILVEQLIRAVISGPQLLDAFLPPHPGCHRVHVDSRE